VSFRSSGSTLGERGKSIRFYLLPAVTYLYAAKRHRLQIPDRVMARECSFFKIRAGLLEPHMVIAVEEHFYIILPLLLLFMVNASGEKSVLAHSTACVGRSPRWFSRYDVSPPICQPTYGLYTHRFPTHLCIDAPFFGVLISYFYHFHTDAFRNLLIDGASLDRRRERLA